MLSWITSLRHEWGKGCRSDLMHLGSSFSAWILGDHHTPGTESGFSSPWIPLIHSSRPYSKQQSPQGAAPVWNIYGCATQLSGYDSSPATMVILRDSPAALTWPWVILRNCLGPLFLSLEHNASTNRLGRCGRVEKLLRQTEVKRRGGEVRALVLGEDVLHRKLSKKEQCVSGSLLTTSFILEKAGN